MHFYKTNYTCPTFCLKYSRFTIVNVIAEAHPPCSRTQETGVCRCVCVCDCNCTSTANMLQSARLHLHFKPASQNVSEESHRGGERGEVWGGGRGGNEDDTIKSLFHQHFLLTELSSHPPPQAEACSSSIHLSSLLTASFRPLPAQGS